MPDRSRLTLSPLHRLVDWFIPAELAADRDVRQRARMFLISHIFGPFLGHVITVYLYLLDPSSGFVLGTLAGSISIFWAFPLLLRLTGQYTVLAVISVQNLIFAILWGCYYYGGVSSPFLPWLLTVPLLAFFYLGPAQRPRWFVLGMIATNLIGFYVFYALGNAFPMRVPLASLQGIGIVSMLCAAVYVSMMALYYANILASQSELETEVRGHLATATELRRAAAEAERAVKAKSEFLAKMSHELRTPLNALIGYSEIMLEDAEGVGNDGMAADLDKIHGAGQHLLRLITDVLDLSKIEAGRMELFDESVDAGALVADAAERCRELAERNGNELVIELDAPLGTIVCDAKKLQQVIVNLLENAARFTRHGRIGVSAQRIPTGRGDEIAIAVRDSGIGIGKEHMPKLFENFSEAMDSTPSKYGRAGLGLPLSQKLCAMMGGGISVESELGVGSCFTIVVPATRGVRSPVVAAAPAGTPSAAARSAPLQPDPAERPAPSLCEPVGLPKASELEPANA